MLNRVLCATALAALLAGIASHSKTLAQAAVAPPSVKRAEAAVDRVFARWTEKTPGCAAAVSANGSIVLQKAYGMADLEHDIHNTPDTIFEAGSVSKQFTAAAVLLLARDGKLSLDDSVRKYVPELPDYGSPLTIRHMLNHTSGLRDWGSVAAIAGWPRTTRAYTHAHVLDIVSRQRALNFPPGTRWSYSNTGYNVAVIIVSRVSGQPFVDFTRARIFDPLGMHHTSWRDDFTRIVKGRAVAYDDGRDGFHADMPFENVHGNAGLLTTAGDLLRWTRNFSEPKVGDAAFIKEEQTPGRFNDGRSHDYALGLRIAEYKGVREVGHSGSTAGYRAYLADYPDQHVSVSVLCNVSSGAAAQYAHAIADAYLQLPARKADEPSGFVLAEQDAAPLAGVYRNTVTDQPLTISQGSSGLRMDNAPLRAASGARFSTAAGVSLELGRDGIARVTDTFGTVETYQRVTPADLTPRPLTDYAGLYTSDEAEVMLTAAIDRDALVLKRRPDMSNRLTFVYADVFRSGGLGIVRFHRDSAGRVKGLSLTQDRVWDLRFEKINSRVSGSSQRER